MIDIQITTDQVLAAIWLARAMIYDDVQPPPHDSINQVVDAIGSQGMINALTDTGDIEDITINADVLDQVIYLLADQVGLDYPDERIEWNSYSDGITVHDVADLVNANVWEERCDFCGKSEINTNLDSYEGWDDAVIGLGDRIEIGAYGTWSEVYACHDCLEHSEVIKKLFELVYGQK